MIDYLFMSDGLYTLGYVLIHFLWQGSALALLFGILLKFLKTPQSRYATGCIVLLGMIVLPVLTWSYLLPDNNLQGAAVTELSTDEAALPQSVFQVGEIAIIDHSGAAPVSTTDSAVAWLVIVWMIGVGLHGIRFVGGWILTQRLKTNWIQPVSASLLQTFERLRDQSRVDPSITLKQSTRITVPMVVGVLRPIVLIPIGLISGMTPIQLESILAHELAHLRRHDAVINVFQMLVESLLFFHPAVWWVSQRIRVEREFCCDDLALEISGTDSSRYARALIELEERRAGIYSWSLSASGGSLPDRVKRLLGKEVRRTRSIARSSLIVGLLIAMSVVMGACSDAIDLGKYLVGRISTEMGGETQDLRGGYLYITLKGDRGVLVEFPGEKHHSETLILRGPHVEIPIPAGYSFSVDDMDAVTPTGTLDLSEVTITFVGDMKIDIVRGDEVFSRLTMFDAEIVYMMNESVDADELRTRSWDGVLDTDVYFPPYDLEAAVASAMSAYDGDLFLYFYHSEATSHETIVSTAFHLGALSEYINENFARLAVDVSTPAGTEILRRYRGNLLRIPYVTLTRASASGTINHYGWENLKNYNDAENWMEEMRRFKQKDSELDKLREEETSETVTATTMFFPYDTHIVRVSGNPGPSTAFIVPDGMILSITFDPNLSPVYTGYEDERIFRGDVIIQTDPIPYYERSGTFESEDPPRYRSFRNVTVTIERTDVGVRVFRNVSEVRREFDVVFFGGTGSPDSEKERIDNAKSMALINQADAVIVGTATRAPDMGDTKFQDFKLKNLRVLFPGDVVGIRFKDESL